MAANTEVNNQTNQTNKKPKNKTKKKKHQKTKTTHTKKSHTTKKNKPTALVVSIQKNVTLLNNYVHTAVVHTSVVFVSMFLVWVSKFPRAPYQLKMACKIIISRLLLWTDNSISAFFFPLPSRTQCGRVFFLKRSGM